MYGLHIKAFDAMYLLAADDGREAELFGSCQPLARMDRFFELAYLREAARARR